MSTPKSDFEVIEARRDFYVAQRDKHLEQLMAVNGQLSFGALALVVGAFVSMNDLPSLDFARFSAIAWATVIILVFLFLVGAAGIAYATYKFSDFHTGRITALQEKIALAEPGLPTEIDCTVIPPRTGRKLHPFGAIFGGLTSLLSATVLLVLLVAANPADGGAPTPVQVICAPTK